MHSFLHMNVDMFNLWSLLAILILLAIDIDVIIKKQIYLVWTWTTMSG